MSEIRRITSSRLIWTITFFAVLSLIMVSSYIITLGNPILTVLGSFLLLFFAFSLAMLFRELLVPSWLERRGDILTVRWNNWQLSGKAAGAVLNGRHRLRLVLEDPRLTLTPVGPLMGLAGMILKPLLGLLFPAFLAQSYYFKKESLFKKISSGDNRYQMIFPLFLLGKRKAKKWLG